MKKFTVLVALALLAATGTGYAVTCAQDNVPAATLLIPYFKVGRGGVTSPSSDIPEGGVDTLIAVTNVSNINLIAHVTVWNKYSFGVLDFNVPMTGYDVATFRMRDILNGRLNVNALTQDPAVYGGRTDMGFLKDVCFSLIGGFPPSTTYPLGRAWDLPYATPFIRFSNPDPTQDGRNAISSYSVPAYTGSFRTRVWDSLDESGDGTSMTSGASYLDVDNPACGIRSDGVLSGDFSGYVTVDVVNYCTNLFASDANFYVNDALATTGWGAFGPNVLMGDWFFVDPAATGGNISGDAAVAIEFDSRLDWFAEKTFYGRYWTATDSGSTPATVPVAYRFVGDGREPLNRQYAFRYLNDSASGSMSWAIVWRSDLYYIYAATDGSSATANVLTETPTRNLCAWLVWNWLPDADYVTLYVRAFNSPSISAGLWDEDENSYTVAGGGPSGDVTSTSTLRIYIETLRLKFASVSALNPAGYKFGWTRWVFNGVTPLSSATAVTFYAQAWVGIEHTSAGAFVSVGHAAMLNNNDFSCTPGSVYGAGVLGYQGQ